MSELCTMMLAVSLTYRHIMRISFAKKESNVLYLTVIFLFSLRYLITETIVRFLLLMGMLRLPAELIVNISVGMPVKNIENPDEDILVKKVEELWNAGLVVVVAAGNDGPAPHTITSPGTSRKVITVGTGTEAGGEYSGQGPVLGSCVCKPDIIAPATNILSCDNHGKSYKKRSGTSMATPIVSGTIALLLSNEPWLSNRDVKIRLMQNAVDCGMAKSRQGWGLLNPEGMLRIK